MARYRPVCRGGKSGTFAAALVSAALASSPVGGQSRDARTLRRYSPEQVALARMVYTYVAAHSASYTVRRTITTSVDGKSSRQQLESRVWVKDATKVRIDSTMSSGQVRSRGTTLCDGSAVYEIDHDSRRYARQLASTVFGDQSSLSKWNSESSQDILLGFLLRKIGDPGPSAATIAEAKRLLLKAKYPPTAVRGNKVYVLPYPDPPGDTGSPRIDMKLIVDAQTFLLRKVIGEGTAVLPSEPNKPIHVVTESVYENTVLNSKVRDDLFAPGPLAGYEPADHVRSAYQRGEKHLEFGPSFKKGNR